MKKTLILLFIVFSSIKYFGQIDTIFFSSYLFKTTKDKASYYRIVSKIDSILFKVETYNINGIRKNSGYSKRMPEFYNYTKDGEFKEFFPNGNLKTISAYKSDELTGTEKRFFENGNLYMILEYDGKSTPSNTLTFESPYRVIEVFDSIGNQLVYKGNGYAKTYSFYNNKISNIEEGKYVNGYQDSTWTGCYASGKLCYKEEYSDGELIRGNSYDLDGKEYYYEEFGEQAEYIGGIKELYKFLGENIVYPKKCRNQGIEGKVYIKFVVEKDGSISEAFVMNDVDKRLANEALRVVLLMSGKWISAKNRAQPVRSWFTIPVNFKLT
jgi:TonB family protein